MCCRRRLKVKFISYETFLAKRMVATNWIIAVGGSPISWCESPLTRDDSISKKISRLLVSNFFIGCWLWRRTLAFANWKFSPGVKYYYNTPSIYFLRSNTFYIYTFIRTLFSSFFNCDPSLLTLTLLFRKISVKKFLNQTLVLVHMFFVEFCLAF